MMLKRFLSGKFRLINLQWYILEQQLKSTLLTIAATFLLMMIFSVLIVEWTPWRESVEQLIGLTIFSPSYFILLASIFFIGCLSSVVFSFWFGYPVSRDIKKRLLAVADAAEAVSRGKLNYRLPVDGRDEISQVSQKYNLMADQIESQVQSLQRLVNQNEELLKHAQQAASLEERRKLAHELHDAVSQQLFAISMTLSALPRIMGQQPEKAKQLLTQVDELVNQAQQELRALILHLRPVTLDGQSLEKGIDHLLSDIQNRSPDLDIQWKVRLSQRLHDGIEHQLFRVIQEGMSNVLRHANASRFSIKLEQREQRIILIMEDNGKGFDRSNVNKNSVGLSSMEERVKDIGGRLDLITSPNHGTRIEIRVPLDL